VLEGVTAIVFGLGATNLIQGHGPIGVTYLIGYVTVHAICIYLIAKQKLLFVQLVQTPWLREATPGPAYVALHVAGHSYIYRVITVNSFGNRHAPRHTHINGTTGHGQWMHGGFLAIFLTAHAVMADPVEPDQAERRDISYALDVEQLDLNLYRSRNLTLPFQARGLFGGQVISQALVAATRCVESEFTLHVRAHSHAYDICSGSR